MSDPPHSKPFECPNWQCPSRKLDPAKSTFTFHTIPPRMKFLSCDACRTLVKVG